jgi:hypothetical protein
MVFGFQQTSAHSHVAKSGNPGNAFRFSGHPQDSRTDFNDSHSSDAKAKLHAIRGQEHAYPHQGKGKKAKAQTSAGVGGKLIPRGTAVS